MAIAKAMTQVILAVLFIGCLFQVPYGYYQFLRLASFTLFGLLAFIEYKKKLYPLTILCICALLLFNPIKPIYLDKDTWQPIDKAMASLMILWIMIDTVLYFTHLAKKKSRVGQIKDIFHENFENSPE